MQTALSVGARLSLEPTGTDLPVVKGPDGLPFIPGSSIKGTVRSQAERILRTVNRRPDLWACDPFADPCVSGGRKAELWQQAEKINRQQGRRHFRRAGLGGKLHCLSPLRFPLVCRSAGLQGCLFGQRRRLARGHPDSGRRGH
jgi:CRISPR/Cas system CSM-associated protein Csm3 (group 7 of RAMP superfamily)